MEEQLPFPPSVTVSRETEERLRRFHDLLLRWTKRINLIAPSTQADAWNRHIVDSAMLWPHLPEDAQNWVDLGSGGGLPGAVIAILAAEKRPDLAVTMVESDRRKAAFLQQVVAELGLTAKVAPCRIEEVSLPPQDVISARALAPLARLIALSLPLSHERTIMLFPKGRTTHSELTEADRCWHIQAEVVPSPVGDGGIVKILGVGART